MTKIKCAVYVRKSTEHGLEQEFNSLQNQEEACKAYIASQAFNNWEYVRTYTDAALSGGTMERPALKQMLNDMAHGLINMVVVYKVDRLSRSILDFHNMMKEFEKYNANFVSITQAFDTSTSMGKLTLNMLLSFAQFEREVASERVRDKIRATRAKGKWTGGIPWLGYDVVDKKLVVNKTEAKQVQTIFEMYLQLDSVSELAVWLRQNGIMNKQWTTQNGKTRGGHPLSTTTLHRILREKIYIGYLEHKKSGNIVKGEHEPIINQELFDKVQQHLNTNTNNKTTHNTTTNNLLSGKVYNSDGVMFTNQSTNKPGRRVIRYYATPGFYLPAADIDKLAHDTVKELLNADLHDLRNTFAHTIKQINYDTLNYDQRRQLTQTLITKAIYSTNKITFFINTTAEIERFTTSTFINQNTNTMNFIIRDTTLIIEKDIIMNKGFSSTKYRSNHGGIMTKTENNHLILRAFATAWKYREQYERTGSVDTIAAQDKVSPMTVYRYLNLAYMMPDKVNAILSGEKEYTVDELFNL